MAGSSDEIETEIDTEIDTEIEPIVEPIDIDNPDVIETARRRYGGAGAALAAGMFGLDVALGNKKKPDSVQIQEAPTDPVDVDADGIQMTIDDTLSVNSPALDRVPPLPSTKKRSRRG